MVSSGFFKERLSQLVTELCSQFNYQFILITQDTELLEFLIENPLVCNYRVGLVDNETKISTA